MIYFKTYKNLTRLCSFLEKYFKYSKIAGVIHTFDLTQSISPLASISLSDFYEHDSSWSPDSVFSFAAFYFGALL